MPYVPIQMAIPSGQGNIDIRQGKFRQHLMIMQMQFVMMFQGIIILEVILKTLSFKISLTQVLL